MIDVEATRDALLERFGEDAAEGLDRLVHAVEKRCAERQRRWARDHREELAGGAWDRVHEAITEIDPDEES